MKPIYLLRKTRADWGFPYCLDLVHDKRRCTIAGIYFSDGQRRHLAEWTAKRGLIEIGDKVEIYTPDRKTFIERIAAWWEGKD